MICAWRACMEMQLGIYRPDKERVSPLAPRENANIRPDPPLLAPHKIWLKVCVCVLSLLITLFIVFTVHR
jgi:hypothetical protein